MRKRIICLLCVVCLLIAGMGLPQTSEAVSGHDSKEQEVRVKANDKVIFSGGGIEVTYVITGVWDYSYNVDVTVKNYGDETIHNWALMLYLEENKITNIWNSKIANHEEGVYLLDNNDSNMDIRPDNTINFGFTASYEGSKIYMPKSFVLTNCEKDVPKEDYSIAYNVNSTGGGQMTADMKISNNSEDVIEDWSLIFQYENDITNLWCANMECKNKENGAYSYFVRNPGWSQNINSKDTYSFGFQAKSDNVNAVPGHFEMKCYDNSINYEADADEDGMTDICEIFYGTNPYVKDTDGDGLDDYIEVFRLGLNPLKADTDGNNIKDGDEDTDGDGLSNLFEIERGLEPWNEDTDCDGLKDGDEINIYMTEPDNEDTDGDTLLDGSEIKLGFNPAKRDTDDNGITDDKEKVYQKISEDIYGDNTNDGAVTAVSVDMNVTGDIEEHTTVYNTYNIDMHSSEVVGLVGVPVCIESGGQFDSATITFQYDREKLGDTSEDDLAIMWYDEENDDYVIYDEESVLDKENQTISYTTTHFSTYLIVNKNIWQRVWENEINYRTASKDREFADVVFAVDASGSMKGSEINNAKKALKLFVDAKMGNDRCSVIQFNDSAEVLSGFKKNSESIKKEIDEIIAGGKTDVANGLKKAIKQYTKSSYKDVGNSKNILLICDGDLEYNQEIVDLANENGISIYTILVGDDNKADLKKIAYNTGGKFSLAEKASALSAAIFGMEQSIMGEIDTTDSDGDGIYDVYEEKGMLCSNGRIIKTNKYKKDSDGDGLSDYSEMSRLVQRPKKILKKGTKDYIYAKCFTYVSNPNKIDSDGDEYNDKEDNKPLKKDVILVGIKDDKNFLPIQESLKPKSEKDKEFVWEYKPIEPEEGTGEIFYGGDQGWWKGIDDKFAGVGCGIIAASNILQYYERRDKGTTSFLSKEEYMGYTNALNKDIWYMPFVGGTIGLNISNGIERFKPNYKAELKASFFSGAYNKRERMMNEMIAQLKDKNPIIFSVGPYILGNKENGVKMKKSVDGSLINYKYSIVDKKGGGKRVETLYDHYVTLTGIVFNLKEQTTTFQISSWGEKYYVDYDEICDYVDEYHNAMFCDAIFVEEK